MLPNSSIANFYFLAFQVTDNPEKIWNSTEYDSPSRILDPDTKDDMYSLLVKHLKRLVRERDQG
jgi:hypothetical protein